MRRFIQIVLLTLVLMTVALISALTSMQLAIHGREVTIPKIVGMTPADAERAGGASGLQIVIERQFYSSDVPEGRIMTQTPAPGTKVRRGWLIRAAQSLGPQRVAIPDLTGTSARAAELNLRHRALTLGSMAQVSLPDSPRDQVVSQSPPPNANGVSAPRISLLVSAGSSPESYVMPNLTGQPLGSVTLTLQDAGLRVGKVSVLPPVTAPGAEVAVATSSEASAASMIVTQWPAPGQKITAGDAVNFEVR